MQLVAQEDVEATLGFVFDCLSDFSAHERSLLRRGIEVQRTDTLAEPGAGMSWDLLFELLAKPRQVRAEVMDFERPDRMVMDLRSNKLSGTLAVDLVALSKSRTRIRVQANLEAHVLSARLFLHSVRLSRRGPAGDFHKFVAQYAGDLEERYKAGA